ncbi:cyclic nucleotide-binding domain-containing protein [Flavobacterium sp. NST-5]|uniref:Cyclic nucleotide-binding domain-containing protein n=1 Tax=Flavobacterium ichthyis TaxID=2698827 RepID=A0ABW9ZBH0_9FLAO|nr:Crp/Fnr family transcriptional regulator [Flavobacterium ichthyis]NBL64138.1 cyclic nucleotide-binding domain-containing protein [Flavobacterium ichthyis]
MFQSIDQNLSRYVAFSNEELDILHANLSLKKFPKKTILLREGEICSFEAYVNQGCLRKYYIDSNGNEVIIQFALEDAWIGDTSFSSFESEPSKMFIETLEDVELLMFSPESKENLLEKAPRFERAFRILLQRNLAATQNRLFHTISQTATERYLEFSAKYPTIQQRVPQHFIASYLGISPEFLSKIRTKLAKA